MMAPNSSCIAAHALPLNCCTHPLGHVPVHANPESLFVLLHSTFAVPPFFGLMLMSLNFSPVHGAPGDCQYQLCISNNRTHLCYSRSLRQHCSDWYQLHSPTSHR